MKYNIDRFIMAQERDYEMALLEIKEGKKRSHWMWYIFPQLRGLGNSAMAEFYGLDGFDEAMAYYKNEYLREHLIEISNVLYGLSGDISYIMGYPDDLKLKSCMTLFNIVDPDNEIFKNVIDKFYDGKEDLLTLKMVKNR